MSLDHTHRYRIESPLHAHDPASGAVLGDIKDLSQVGLMMVTQHRYESLRTVRIQIGTDPAATVLATAIWTAPHPDTPFHCLTGFSFQPETDASRAAIVEAIRQHGVPHRVPVAVARKHA